MAQPMASEHSDSLGVLRLIMVLSSISPLFILIAIRGTTLFSPVWFIGGCVAMVILPNLVLWIRVFTAKKNKDNRQLEIGKAEDHRVHLIAYLFAILLPFYRQDVLTNREFAAIVVALGFIVFIFWHLNLHYVNLLFALFGYRVYTVYPEGSDNPHSGKSRFVLVTRRTSLHSGQQVTALRLSDTVYLE